MWRRQEGGGRGVADGDEGKVIRDGNDGTKKQK